MAWICPECGKEFKNKNQAHSCAKVDLSCHFRNKSANVKEIFEQLIQELNKLGKISLNPVKTSIQIKARATVLSFKPKKDTAEIEFQLDREDNRPPVYKTFRISRNRVLHFAVLESPQDISAKLMNWLKKSYELANQ